MSYAQERCYLSAEALEYIAKLKELGIVDDDFATELAVKLLGEKGAYELGSEDES